MPSGGSLAHPATMRFLFYEELKRAIILREQACLERVVLTEFSRAFLVVALLSQSRDLPSGGPQGDNEFLVEVEMLSRLLLSNLVKVVGYYSSHNSSHNLLCYEFVPN